MIRLLSLVLDDFKNIVHGEIVMPGALRELPDGRGDIVGLYGRNGSGKTAVVEAIDLLQRLWRGEALGKEDVFLLRQGSTGAVLCATLLYEKEGVRYTLEYRVYLYDSGGGEDGGVRIIEESLKVREDRKHARMRLLARFDVPLQELTQRDAPATYIPSLFPLGLDKALHEVYGVNGKEPIVRKAICYDRRKSYLFDEELSKQLGKAEPFLKEVIEGLSQYARTRLFVVSRMSAGLIACNFIQPFSLCEPGLLGGRLSFGMEKPAILPKVVFDLFKGEVDKMNVALPQLIVGCSLEVRSLGEEFNDKGESCERFELWVRKGEYCFPLRYESEGTKKLVSILSLLIAVFNHPDVTVVIDELDAGIYEFLLGELLAVMRCEAKGQLIFTAHNLHPLEVLDRDSIVVTTLDVKHCFARFPRAHLKPSNNFRSVYLRSITLGGQDFEVYDYVQRADIARAFRKGGAR